MKGGGRQEETLKSTPPTGSVQDLITMQQALELKHEAYSIDEKEDWKKIRKEILEKVCPIKDLMKVLKDRQVAIDKRKTGRKKQSNVSAAPTVLNANRLFFRVRECMLGCVVLESIFDRC